MKRKLAALALTAIAIVGLPGSVLAAQTAGGGCNEPLPERTYTGEALVYRLVVDLTLCDWWDGSAIQLEVDLERLDGTGGHGAGSATICGVGPTLRPDHGEERATEKPAKPKSGVCEVQVAIEHPPVEVAYYRGEVSFPWDGGRRTLSFIAVCGQPAGCLDLPVDPMPTLAPIGDVIVGDINAF